MTIFAQRDFFDGLDTELDYTKSPQTAYPLLINGRARRDTIEPTYKHVLLDAPTGLKQGIFVAGSIVVLFVAGQAYYTDITLTPILFHPVAGWTPMNATASRIYAEITPATGNFFNNQGNPQLVDRVFNSAIANYSQVLQCFDGSTQSQAIFPDGHAELLGTYSSWTKDKPNYVPIGVLPAPLNNKLFLVSPDRKRILHSVSGRMSDFMVNITATGDKGGDADTVSQVVSFNDITAIKPIASGQLLVTTLYASYVISTDYDNPIFGEPYLFPTDLFPVGCLNELSITDILQDTAFITQSGIHSFNTVMQAKRESNNMPFGAKIHGLLRNPQQDTCTALHNDYAYFAVNTIFGYGAIVYDTIRKNFQSLDLSFGQVKQFANTRISGAERLFFITSDNRLYEAFGSSAVNATKVYLGEFCPDTADSQVKVQMINLQFGSVRSSGQCKVGVYVDKKLTEEKVFQLDNDTITENFPIPVPFVAIKQAQDVSYALRNATRGWRVGVMVEWNFDGSLTDMSIDGAIEKASNVSLVQQEEVTGQDFAFVADTGYGDELNTGGNFLTSGIAIVDVEDGAYYIFDSNGDGPLVTGDVEVTSGIFKATTNQIVVKGTASGLQHFTLRNADNFLSVINSIQAFKPDGKSQWSPAALLGGGDHSYPSGALLDVTLGVLPLRLPFWPVAGNHEYDTNSASSFFNKLRIPRYYIKPTTYVDFFFYNGGWTSANVGVNSTGITTGATSEPDGNNGTSLQYNWLRNAIEASSKPFKIIIVHEPPYTTDALYYPGYADLRALANSGAHAILSGHGHNMERRIVNNFPFFVCGTGGKSLRGFADNTSNVAAFRDSDHYGFLSIEADPLTCLISFVDVNGVKLDSFALYA